MATGCFPGKLHSLASVRLGRIVLDPKNPHQDFIDPSLPHAPEFIRNSQNNFRENWTFSRSSSLRPYLSTFSVSYERQNTGLGTLSAPSATTYDLQHPREWFEEACGLAETRKFLEKENNNRRKVYLVIGFRTVHNGTLVKGTTWKKDKVVGTTMSMPTVGTISIASGATVGRDVERDQELAFDGPGEQVFAIMYRKIKFKWLSKRTVDNMSLGVNNRWTAWWEWRGAEEEEENDAVLEAYLTEASDLDVTDDYVSGDELSEDDSSEDGTDCSGGGGGSDSENMRMDEDSSSQVHRVATNTMKRKRSLEDASSVAIPSRSAKLRK